MIKAVSVVFVGAMLAGCAPNADTQRTARGDFSSYRDLLADESLHILDRNTYARIVPRPVIMAYVDCAADFVLSKISASDRARLDAYARHETTMSANEAKEIERRMTEGAGGDITYATLDRLSETCPADVPSFKEHLEPVLKPI